MIETDRELFELYCAASPEKKAAIKTLLTMAEKGHTLEEAVDAIEDDLIRETLKKNYLQTA